jgi:hypothetical protein
MYHNMCWRSRCMQPRQQRLGGGGRSVSEIRVACGTRLYTSYRTGERKAVREMSFARGNMQLATHFKLSQNYYLTCFPASFLNSLWKETLFKLTTNSNRDLSHGDDTARTGG